MQKDDGDEKELFQRGAQNCFPFQQSDQVQVTIKHMGEDIYNS